MMPKLFAQCSSTQCPAVMDQVRQMVMTSQPVAIAAAYRGMAVRPDMSGLLPSIRIPTLVICGEHDVISPPEKQAAAESSAAPTQRMRARLARRPAREREDREMHHVGGRRCRCRDPRGRQ